MTRGTFFQKVKRLEKKQRLTILKYFTLFFVVSLIIYVLIYPRVFGVLFYLKQHTSNQGRYDYTYYPMEGFTGYSYNLIRHTAMTYVLTDYIVQNHHVFSILFRRDILRTLDYALSQQLPCHTNRKKDFSCLYFAHDSPTFAANAFAILAIGNTLKIYTLTKEERTRYLDEMIKLEKYISDSFDGASLVFSSSTPNTSKRYQEGQVLMAWSSLYEMTGNTQYRDNATQLHKSILKRMHTTQDYFLHHWFWLGLREYHRVTKTELSLEEKEYIIKAAKQALSLQVTKPDDPLYGTFVSEPSLLIKDTAEEIEDPRDPASLGVRIEGLGSLYYLLSLDTKSCSVEDICDSLKNAITRSVPVFERGQVNVRRLFAGYSFTSFGGFTANQRDSMIQIDYLQHALSAYQTIKNVVKD